MDRGGEIVYSSIMFAYLIVNRVESKHCLLNTYDSASDENSAQKGIFLVRGAFAVQANEQLAPIQVGVLPRTPPPTHTHTHTTTTPCVC